MLCSNLKAIALLLFIGLGFCSPVFAAENVSDERAAMAASAEFLGWLDAGQFQRCWDEAAPLFRERTNEEQWIQDITHLRKALGNTLKRSIQFKKEMTSIDDGPEGEYRFFIYRTAFEKKAAAIETVTVVQDKGGRWRVVGLTAQ